MVSNHRPLACEASALPLSYAPGEGSKCRRGLGLPGIRAHPACGADAAWGDRILASRCPIPEAPRHHLDNPPVVAAQIVTATNPFRPRPWSAARRPGRGHRACTAAACRRSRWRTRVGRPRYAVLVREVGLGRLRALRCELAADVLDRRVAPLHRSPRQSRQFANWAVEFPLIRPTPRMSTGASLSRPRPSSSAPHAGSATTAAASTSMAQAARG